MQTFWTPVITSRIKNNQLLWNCTPRVLQIRRTCTITYSTAIYALRTMVKRFSFLYQITALYVKNRLQGLGLGNYPITKYSFIKQKQLHSILDQLSLFNLGNLAKCVSLRHLGMRKQFRRYLAETVNFYWKSGLPKLCLQLSQK